MKTKSHQFIWQETPGKPRDISEKPKKTDSPKATILKNLARVKSVMKIANEDISLSDEEITFKPDDFFDKEKFIAEVKRKYLNRAFSKNSDIQIVESLALYIWEQIDKANLVMSSHTFARKMSEVGEKEVKLEEIGLKIPFGKKTMIVVLYYKGLSLSMDPKISISLDPVEIETWAKSK